ncbi:unnamed protein product, partial [Aphanomyces euteiches]
ALCLRRAHIRHHPRVVSPLLGTQDEAISKVCRHAPQDDTRTHDRWLDLLVGQVLHRHGTRRQERQGLPSLGFCRSSHSLHSTGHGAPSSTAVL